MVRSLSVATPTVELGGEGGDGFDAGFGVAGEGAGVLVSALGLQKDGRHTGLTEVGEG